MIRYFFILLACIYGSASYGRLNDSLRLIHKISGNFTFITTDNLSNIYAATATGGIVKYSNEGDSLGANNTLLRLGNINHIDASNPFKILVYYKSFSQIAILDRFLNLKKILDLKKVQLTQVQVICSAYDNTIWLYDELEGNLKKIDDFGNILFSSADFRQLFTEQQLPTYIHENNKLVYLYYPSGNIYVFDYFGNYKQFFYFTNCQPIIFTSQYAIALCNNTLITTQLETTTTHKTSLPVYLHTALYVLPYQDMIFALKNNGIEIYSSL